MTVLTNNERLDRAILDLDGRVNSVRSICVSIISEIDAKDEIPIHRIEQIMDNFNSHIDFFERVSIRQDVIDEVKIQYNNADYDTSVEYPALVALMKRTMEGIMTYMGVDAFWNVFKYDENHVKV